MRLRLPNFAPRCPRPAGIFALIWLVGMGLAAAEEASKAPRPLLWKIEAQGGKPSWLFGTIHLARPDVTALPASVQAALDGAGAVYTEIPSDIPTMLALVHKTMLPKGESAWKLLGPELTAEVEKELRSINPQLTFEPLSKFQLWVLATTLPLIEDQLKYAGAMAMDTLIFQRAAMAGKKVGGIEKPEEQLAAFADFSDAEQVTMVRDALKQMRKIREQGTSVSDLLTKLYLDGDLDRLMSELMQLDTNEHPELTEKFLDRLLYRRNEVMAQRITKFLRSAPDTSWFFAVGAGHLQGEKGLLRALEKAGFKLTRVR